MVRVKAPLMSMSAQKQLGHSLIYKQKGSRSFVTGYNKPGGKNPSPASATQKNKRMIYNLIIARWQTFTDEEKAVYNDLVKAKNLNMSGWNYFYQQSLTDLPTYLGLQGYWSFNEIVGGKILDLSGNGNDGTLEPAYPTNAPQLVDSIGKKFGKAGSFDGVDDRIDVGIPESLMITEHITLEAWIKPTTDDDIASYVIGFSPHASEYNYALKQTNKTITAALGDAQSGSIVTGDVITELNKWYHIVYTASKLSTEKIYIDGVDSGATGTAGSVLWGGGSIKIGALRGDNFTFSGGIDEVRIYDRVLSASEVLKHYELISKK